MPLTYDSKNANKCWPKGDYDATLANVEDTTSKRTGQPMQKWTIEVYNKEGKKTTLFNYVTAGFPLSVKMLAKALGKETEFKANQFQADDHVGANFRVTLDIEDNAEYGEQNKIKAWLSKAGGASSANKPTGYPTSSLAEVKADGWKKFVALNPNTAKADLEAKFAELVDKTFGKSPSALTIPNWNQLVKSNFELPSAPFGDEKEFSDDQIPF